jgi:hypothetical protein
MDTQSFITAIKGLSAIPEDQKAEFLRIAGDLPADRRAYIFTRLSALNAELTKNDEKHASSLQRMKAMTRQVEESNVADLRKLTDA